MPSSALQLLASAVVFAALALAGIGWPRRRVKRALGLLGRPTDVLAAGARVTVAGTLRPSGGPLRTDVPAGSEKPVRAVLGAKTRPFGVAYVETSSARVYLGPDVQIVVGSREERVDGEVVHAVADGDRVVVAGRLESEANPDEAPAGAGYREVARVFRLVGSPDAPPVIVAVRGPARPRVGWPVFAAAMAVFSLVMVAMVALSPVAKPMGPGWSPLPRSACGAAIDARLAGGDLPGADRAAASCDDPLARAHAAFARGDFANAHREFVAARAAAPNSVPTVPEIQTASLAGDFAGAATLTDALANAWYRGPRTREQRRLACVVDAFASRAKGARVGDLVQPGHGRNESWCNFLAADLESDLEARSAALQGPDDVQDTRRLLYVEAGERGDWFLGRPWTEGQYAQTYIREYPIGALYDPILWLSHGRVELERSIASRIDPTSPLAHEMAAQAALFAAITASPGDARRFLDGLATPGGTRTPYIVGAIAALYIGDRALAEKLLDLGSEDSHAVGIIRRTALPALSGGAGAPLFPRDEEPWNADVFRAIATGSGASVAAVLRREGKPHLFELLRAKRVLAPAELGPLRAWLRGSYPAPDWTHGLLAVGLALGGRLVAAELLEDAETSALLRPRVAAFARALTERDPTSRMSDPTLANDLLERAQDVEVTR